MPADEPPLTPPVRPPEPPYDRHELSLGEKLLVGADGRVRPAVRAIAFGATAFVASTLAAAIVGPLIRDTPLWIQMALQSTAILAGVALVTLFFLRFGDGTGWRNLGLDFRKGWAKRVGLGAALGLALQAAIAAALIATHSQHYDTRNAWGAAWWGRLAGDVWLFGAAAASEELLFRGYALQRLMDAGGAAFGIIATSIAFGLAHIWNPDATLFSTLNTILAGILFGAAYVRTKDLWLQCSLHAAWNFFMGPIFCLPVSGIIFGPRTFSTHLSGAIWWTGGGYGPEGGLVGTLAVLAGVAVLLLRRRSALPLAIDSA